MAHEDLSREQQVEGSTDRAFGLVFAGAFLLIAGWPLFHGETPRWWALGVAVVFAIIAIWKPALLAVPNRLWFKLGLLLGKVVSPVALGIDRKSTRLNSSHGYISYAVFCLKKKKNKIRKTCDRSK